MSAVFGYDSRSDNRWRYVHACGAHTINQAGMRRDYFTLNATGMSVDKSGRPVIRITYQGPTEELEPRLRRDDETRLDNGDIDVAYRLLDRLGADAPMGVFAIANRVTGEYILELNVDVASIFDVVEAAGETDDTDGTGRYRVVIETETDTHLATYDKSTLLVYGNDGGLLRDRSLIPSGVEI